MMKNKINILSFLIIIFGLSIFSFIKKDDKISLEERRYLTQAPNIEENILKGTFSKKYEEYLLDQFPYRDNFRKIKAIASYNIFNKIENNNITVYNDTVIKLQPDYDYTAISVTINKLNNLKNTLFKNNNVYFALIPDKNCFYDKFDDVSCDYEKIEEIINDNLDSSFKYIPIKNDLNLDMYYKTDSHWSQDKITNVSNILLSEMNNTVYEQTFDINLVDNFKGVYLSQACVPIKKDVIKYLTNDAIKNAIVYNYETNSETKVYDLEKLTDDKSLDNYDIFLSGASSLLKITNKNSKTNKTLIMFRDSYGSSLAPLFIDNYKEIYMIDLRYINSKLISNYININGDEDVLFIYSTTLINIPNNFKIN